MKNTISRSCRSYVLTGVFGPSTDSNNKAFSSVEHSSLPGAIVYANAVPAYLSENEPLTKPGFFTPPDEPEVLLPQIGPDADRNSD